MHSLKEKALAQTPGIPSCASLCDVQDRLNDAKKHPQQAESLSRFDVPGKRAADRSVGAVVHPKVSVQTDNVIDISLEPK